MPKYLCKGCGVIADIDMKARTKKFVFKGPRKEASFPKAGHKCELAKGLDNIDFSKLEKV